MSVEKLLPILISPSSIRSQAIKYTFFLNEMKGNVSNIFSPYVSGFYHAHLTFWHVYHLGYLSVPLSKYYLIQNTFINNNVFVWTKALMGSEEKWSW